MKSCEKEVYPNMKFEVPQRRGALHDSENCFLSRFGAEKVCKGWSFDGASMVEEEGRKSNVRMREKSFWILLAEWVRRERTWLCVFRKGFLSFIFFKSCATCLLLSGAKRGPLFLLMWLILSHKKGKIWPFEALKSYLGLRVISVVPVPRISLHPSGPVFESKQYIYISKRAK